MIYWKYVWISIFKNWSYFLNKQGILNTLEKMTRNMSVRWNIWIKKQTFSIKRQPASLFPVSTMNLKYQSFYRLKRHKQQRKLPLLESMIANEIEWKLLHCFYLSSKHPYAWYSHHYVRHLQICIMLLPMGKLSCSNVFFKDEWTIL